MTYEATRRGSRSPGGRRIAADVEELMKMDDWDGIAEILHEFGIYEGTAKFDERMAIFRDAYADLRRKGRL